LNKSFVDISHLCHQCWIVCTICSIIYNIIYIYSIYLAYVRVGNLSCIPSNPKLWRLTKNKTPDCRNTATTSLNICKILMNCIYCIYVILEFDFRVS
jgi:hypothetical protein